MKNDAQPKRIQGGFQPETKGFQPQSATPLRPADLKPPKGDTAIQPASTQAEPPPASPQQQAPSE